VAEQAAAMRVDRQALKPPWHTKQARKASTEVLFPCFRTTWKLGAVREMPEERNHN